MAQAKPFKTRREFFEEACRLYLQDLKRKMAYQKMEEACHASADMATGKGDQGG